MIFEEFSGPPCLDELGVLDWAGENVEGVQNGATS